MVILKQTTVQRCLGKGKFAECWLILAHEQDGPAILIFKDHTAKKMIEDKITVTQVAERMRFGTTTVTLGSCPETKNDDIKIHPSCYMAISTEKLIKKQPKPYIIWLCVNSIKELFSIVRLLSASLSCLQIPAPLAYTKDDTLALHNYVPLSFKPRNEWEEYWDNPPMIMPDSPINLTLAQNSGLAKSYDQLEDGGGGTGGKLMKRKQQKDEAKKKMYSSTPTLAEPIQQAGRAPRSTSQSSSSTSDSELDTAPAKPRRFKQRSKPQSIETISTFDFAENAKKPSSRFSQHNDPNEWDVMYPTLDLPSRPLTSQRTHRRYESPTEKRSRSAISSPSGTLPQRYSPKSIPLQPSSTVSKSESFESDLDQQHLYGKDPYSPSILKQRPAPVAPILASPRSSPPLLQHHRSQILYEQNPNPEAPLYEYLTHTQAAAIPRKQSDSDKSVHSMHSIHSSHSKRSASEKPIHRYDYPPVEQQQQQYSGLQYTPFELVKHPLHAPITSKATKTPSPRATTPKFVTPIQSPVPPKQHQPPQTPPRKISPILAITPPTTPSPDPRQTTPPLVHVAPVTHSAPPPPSSPQSDSPKPKPLPRVSRYSDAEVQTEHPIQMEPLIETPAHLFDTNVEKLKSLATAPLPDPDPLPAPPPKPVSIKE
uniref:Uncharacterized protein n=1 Tax=Panagrolaimus sp. ES5 TaxID=591445 RepID=A0AC34GST0_9BILA